MRARSWLAARNPLRYGGDDNLPVQGLTGIGIVTVLSLVIAAIGLGVAALVSLIFA